MALKLIASILGALFGFGFLKFAYDKWKELKANPADKKRLHSALFWSGLFVLTLAAEIYLFYQDLVIADLPKTSNAPITSAIDTTTQINYDEEEWIDMGIGKYQGEVDRLLNCDGVGMMKYRNGDIYFGEWSVGNKVGLGNYYFSKPGDLFHGTWKDDDRTGWGEYYIKAADYYSMKQIESLLRGTTSCNGTFPGSYFEGYFIKGEFDNGIFYKWQGELEGKDVNGKTQTTFYTGTYVGEFQGGKFNGKGTFTYENGDTFIGYFESGRLWSGEYTQASTKQTYTILNGVWQK